MESVQAFDLEFVSVEGRPLDWGSDLAARVVSARDVGLVCLVGQDDCFLVVGVSFPDYFRLASALYCLGAKGSKKDLEGDRE